MKHLPVAGKAITLLLTAVLLVACGTTQEEKDAAAAAAAAFFAPLPFSFGTQPPLPKDCPPAPVCLPMLGCNSNF